MHTMRDAVKSTPTTDTGANGGLQNWYHCLEQPILYLRLFLHGVPAPGAKEGAHYISGRYICYGACAQGGTSLQAKKAYLTIDQIYLSHSRHGEVLEASKLVHSYGQAAQ